MFGARLSLSRVHFLLPSLHAIPLSQQWSIPFISFSHAKMSLFLFSNESKAVLIYLLDLLAVLEAYPSFGFRKSATVESEFGKPARYKQISCIKEIQIELVLSISYTVYIYL